MQQFNLLKRNRTSTVTLGVRNDRDDEDFYVPSGNEVIVIPLFVGEKKCTLASFIAIVNRLMHQFKDSPNTPIHIIVIDTINRHKLLYERKDVFSYVDSDFTDEDKNSLDDRIKGNSKNRGYEVIALELAILQGKKLIQECSEGIKRLTSHFTDIKLGFWSNMKQKVIKDYRLKLASLETYFQNHDHERKVIMMEAESLAAHFGKTRLASQAHIENSKEMPNTYIPLSFIKRCTTNYYNESFIVLVEVIKDAIERNAGKKIVLIDMADSSHKKHVSIIHLLPAQLSEEQRSHFTIASFCLSQTALTTTGASDKLPVNGDNSPNFFKNSSRRVYTPDEVRMIAKYIAFMSGFKGEKEENMFLRLQEFEAGLQIESIPGCRPLEAVLEAVIEFSHGESSHPTKR